MQQKTLIVIGGGAAGFFCAVNAARFNTSLHVIIVENSSKLLSKVKVSGGGRCNVTHACFDIKEMSQRYPRGEHWVRKAFHHFFTSDTIQWFEERGVKLKAEQDGRMFPITDSSQTIIDCLLREANKYNVDIRMNTEVNSIRKEENEKFIIQTGKENLSADAVCVACGGYPKTDMFQWLVNTGHTIEPPVPSLFTFNLPKHPITELMGVSVENVKIKIQGTKLEQQGPLLITHWGLSGPAVLKLSAWGARQLAVSNWQFAVSINWLPEYTEQKLAEAFQQLRFSLAGQKMSTKNPFQLPKRFWEFILNYSEINAETRWADLPVKNQNKLIKNLCVCEFAVQGKTTFKEEFVTAGGIQLNEVDVNTMMSKKVDRLYFAGEILDVDGITGGFNFQNAWTTGFVAAKNV